MSYVIGSVTAIETDGTIEGESEGSKVTDVMLSISMGRLHLMKNAMVCWHEAARQNVKMARG
jgi:hypothetical protein